VETLSTIHFAEQWRWRNAAKKKEMEKCSEEEGEE
jgi:hypothetical protein